jgi:hypothetical protein
LRDQNDGQGHAWKNTSELGKTESRNRSALSSGRQTNRAKSIHHRNQ